MSLKKIVPAGGASPRGHCAPVISFIEAKSHQAEMLVDIDCVAYKPRGNRRQDSAKAG